MIEYTNGTIEHLHMKLECVGHKYMLPLPFSGIVSLIVHSMSLQRVARSSGPAEANYSEK